MAYSEREVRYIFILFSIRRSESYLNIPSSFIYRSDMFSEQQGLREREAVKDYNLGAVAILSV